MRGKTKDIELIEPEAKTWKWSLLEDEIQTDLSTKSGKGKGKERHYSSLKKDEESDDKSTRENFEEDDSKKKGKGKKKKEDEKKFSWPIWRKLFSYTLRRKILAFTSLFLNIAFGMSVSLLPLKVGIVLDYITATIEEGGDKNQDHLRDSVRQLGIMVLCLAVFTYLRFLSLQFLQEFLAMDMRTDFYRKFISNDMYFFEQYKSGQLVSRLSSDINQAKSAVSNNVTFLIRNFIIIASNIIILFTISWQLTSYVMLLVPVYSFITLQYSKKSKVLVKAYQDVQAEISASVAQKFSGIQLVKACSTQQVQIKNYDDIIMKGYSINRKRIFIQGIYMSCSEFLPYVGILITLWYGGSMVISGKSQMSAGQLTTFIMYCSSLASSTSSISNSYTNIINGTYAVQKVFQMLDYNPLVDESKGQELAISGEIEFKNVNFQYPTSKTPVLRNLSLHIRKGEYIAFVGESGSGKSTIVKLIEKFYKIQGGEIYFGKHNRDSVKAESLRRQIGLVNQQATMFSGTIQSNIAYGIEKYTLQELEVAAEKAGCLQFLRNEKSFPKGFKSEVGEKGNNLSGGQRQRVSIARALMRHPKIIIFDQATSALDANSEQMVQESIQRLALIDHSDKPTIIVIAHRLSTVMNADRIFVMKNGEVVEQGSHRELKGRRGYYFQLVQKQMSDSPQLQSSRELIKEIAG